MNDFAYDNNEKTMPELDQSAPPAPRNEMMTTNSLIVAPERALSVASGNISRDFEGLESGGENKERASIDGPPEGGLQAWTVILGA